MLVLLGMMFVGVFLIVLGGVIYLHQMLWEVRQELKWARGDVACLHRDVSRINAKLGRIVSNSSKDLDA